MSDEGVKVGTVSVTRESEKAIRVSFDEDGRELWIPKSCVHDDSEAYAEGDKGELVLESWFAEKEGLV